MGLGHWGVVLVVDEGVWMLSLAPNIFNPPPQQPPQPPPTNGKGSAGPTTMPVKADGARNARQDRAGSDEAYPEEGGDDDDDDDDEDFE